MRSKLVQAWLDENEHRAFEDWRRRQPIIPREADAVRALLNLGLDASAMRHASEKALPRD